MPDTSLPILIDRYRYVDIGIAVDTMCMSIDLWFLFGQVNCCQRGFIIVCSTGLLDSSQNMSGP